MTSKGGMMGKSGSEGGGEIVAFHKRYISEARQDVKFRRKLQILESRCQKENDVVNMKFSLLVHRGRNAEGVGLA